MTDFSEKREFTRIPLKIIVEVIAGGISVKSETRDVSLNGVYFCCDEKLIIGTDCRVVLHFEGNDSYLSIHMKGKITRVNKSGTGVEFTEMGLDVYNHLKNLVLYNSTDTEKIEEEFKSHLGIKRIR